MYNDAVKPEDPYEFMGLLAATPMQSLKRNEMLEHLAAMIRRDPARAARLKRGESLHEDSEFCEALGTFLTEFGSLPWRHGEPSGKSGRLAPLLLELAERGPRGIPERSEQVDALRTRFLASFSGDRRKFAESLLDLGRASHQLRDDDNIHLSRIEARLLAAQGEARRRLETGRGTTPALGCRTGARQLSREAGPRNGPPQRDSRWQHRLDGSSPPAARSAGGPRCRHRTGASG